MTSAARRLAVLVGVTYRGTFVGGRLWISALLAALPPLFLAALFAYGVRGADLLSGFGNVVVALVLSVQLPLTTLIIGVGLFRTEIEEDTLTFLTLRTIARPLIVIGKYLGGWGAVLTFLLPSFGVTLGVAYAGAAGASFPQGYIAAGLLVVLLGSIAYLAIYLLMGLVASSAVVLGLVYAFLWEFVLRLFPGRIPQVTVYYYLRASAASLTTAAPLGSFSKSVGLAGAIAAPLCVAAAGLLLACLVVGYVETAPGRAET
jgi:ABC-2 type transport system permease protein